MKVWDSIVDDTTLIFQWESKSATAYLKQLLSKETVEKIKEKNPNASYMDLLSIGNGAIRPAGESYRDNLAKGIYQDNGHEALNDFLAPTLGYLVYQEQIIEFLHSFCGYTMGMADLVRRGFSKKLGTEKFIPDIKNGFIKTMKDKYNVQKEESEQLIVSFIKVIEDASAYLFSKNHADPYSWIGYICGYLRYYYPLEYIKNALNIFEGDEEKTLAIIEYAKKINIRISPIQFRKSKAKYDYDKENNMILKGVSSIKHMNATVANELYELKDNHYNSFIDLLCDIKSETSTNSRQLNILIELDYFKEFGDINKLLDDVQIFDAFAERKQLRKAELDQMNVDYDVIRNIGCKETEKMFKGFNSIKLAKYISSNKSVRHRTLKEKIESQIEHLGYINIADEEYAGMGVVLSVDTRYSPRLKVHSLRYGNVIDCKVDKKTFNKNQLQYKDIIRISKSQRKPKTKRDENGHFVPIPDTSEIWLTKYNTLKL